MEFAKKEMKKRGWKSGKGLGKGENGISDAIKVDLKMDGSGLGYDHGEQFTFRWWDHMFTSALNKIDVAEDEHGEVQVKSEQSADAGNPISTKRIAPKFLAKEMLYGRFVRGATATYADASNASDSDSSSSSSSSEDDRPSLTFEETDDKLLAACGGRTAHKGARHGFGQSGKLARLEQQEAAFHGVPEPVKTPQPVKIDKDELETDEKILKKKKKRKRQSDREEEDDDVVEERPKKQRKKPTEENMKSKERSEEKKKSKEGSKEKKKSREGSEEKKKSKQCSEEKKKSKRGSEEKNTTTQPTEEKRKGKQDSEEKKKRKK